MCIAAPGSPSRTSANGPPPGTRGGGEVLGRFWGRLARGARSNWAEEEEDEEEVMCFVASSASCGVGFGVSVLELREQGLGGMTPGAGFKTAGLRFRISGLGSRVQGFGFRGTLTMLERKVGIWTWFFAGSHGSGEKLECQSRFFKKTNLVKNELSRWENVVCCRQPRLLRATTTAV